MSQIVILDIPPYTQAMASGGQTVYGTNWTANAASDVVVYNTPVGNPPNDFTQILSYPSQYSVAFIGLSQQVQVTLVTPSTLGDIVTITRMTPADRVNLYSNTNFLPTMLNNDFGILTLVDQQAQLVNQRIGPRYNYSATIVDVVDTILPILSANQFWAKNGSNTGMVAVDITEIVSGGTVTEIDTGLGLTGGPITNAGTISFGAMNANTFWGNITGGSAVPTMVTTGYFLQSANNLSDLTNVPQAQINIGLQIGVNVEAYSAKLASIAGLSLVVNDLIYATSSSAFGLIAAANNSTLVTSAGGVPSLSTTLPQAVQTNIQYLGTQNQALNMGGFQINNGADPTQPSDFATKNYVDLTALTGTSVYAASAATLGTVTQSGSGVGATLTNAGAQATFALDSVNPPVNSLVLIKNTATGMTEANEGIYTVTDAGSGATNWVLTRATTYDTPSEINHTGLIIVQNGSTLAGTAWYNAANIVTVDVTNFSYSQFGNITFPVSLAHGGTNANLTAVNGGIVYSSSTALAISAAGSSGQIFQSAGAGTPVWTTATYPSVATSTGSFIYANGTNFVQSTSLWPNTVGTVGKIIRSDGSVNAYTTATFADTYAASTLLYSNGINQIVGLATGNNGVLVTDNSGVPSISSTLPAGLLIAQPKIDGIFDTVHDLEVLGFSAASSSVNFFTMAAVITGQGPVLAAAGSDTNIGLTITGKGTSAVNIVGCADASNAPAGSVGEVISSVIASSPGVSLTMNTAANITSISLTAGDWDLYGNVTFTVGGTATLLVGWISTTSATIPDSSVYTFFSSATSTGSQGFCVPFKRINISTTTTVYLSVAAYFSTSTVSGCGGIFARRVR